MAEKFVIALSSLVWLAQLAAVPPSADIGSLITIAEHLTLSAALIIAVVILWKSNARKEDLIVKTTETVTAALGASTIANQELRRQVEALTKAIER